jgi:thymidylate synthase
MFLNYSQNVCEALVRTMRCLLESGVEEDSRAGWALVLPAPLMSVTAHPRERVLFSAVRDANPVFHMVEAIWMLAGRDDARTPSRFVRDFGERYAEPDGRIHDAYGRRWRSAFGFDQLDEIVRRLIDAPRDRQTVITMWDPNHPGIDDLLGAWRTRPCNTHVFVRVVNGLLDLTVCCRSNDMIMGGHGANAVHFSILLEYLAARIDCGVGRLYQLSNNAHVYVKDLETLRRRAGGDDTETLLKGLEDNRYRKHSDVEAYPIFDDPECVDEDIRRFMGYLDGKMERGYYNRAFTHTLMPMIRAHDAHRRKNYFDAMAHAREIRSPDWRIAVQEWLRRRQRQTEEKTDAA